MMQAWRQRVIPPDAPTAAPPDFELFSCVKRNVTLSPRGCGKMWGSANGAKPPEMFEGRYACRGCSIGEANYTGTPPDAGAQLRESAFRICSRCGRAVERRLIHPKTLGLCISCYNRHREALAGRNAKGHPPRIAPLLHTEQALVTTDGGTTDVLTRHHVLHFDELVRQAQRTADVPLTFLRLHALRGGRAVSKNSAIGTLGSVGDPAMPSLSGTGEGSSAVAADLTATVPLAGQAASGCEALATLKPWRRPPRPIDPNVEPVTSWIPPGWVGVGSGTMEEAAGVLTGRIAEKF